MLKTLGKCNGREAVPSGRSRGAEVRVKGLRQDQHHAKKHLSVKTVETHRAHIKEKLNLKSATELVQHAVQWRET
ncbi:MAG: response regulator transcription factor [Verrucomicrobia bacterium]|nr:response regulator transcription factor [Verrucomicrobiota bacterium]